MQGVLFALVPIFAWGAVGLVANILGGDPNQQTLGMTLGAFVFALIVSLFRMPTLTWQIFLIGFIGGLFWAIGQFGQFNSMKYMGVSVASPLSSGSQLVFGVLLGVFAFHEWTKQIQFIIGFIAMALLVVGFYFSAKRDPENAVVKEGHNYTKGLIALTYSTLGYVLYVILFNNLAVLWFNVHFDTLTIILPMSVGMIFGALVMGRFKIKMEKYVYRNIIDGVMFGVGNIFMLMAASAAGNAIAFSFAQLGVIISTIGGILFLGEKKTKKELVYVGIGSVLFVTGAILLAIVKSKG